MLILLVSITRGDSMLSPISHNSPPDTSHAHYSDNKECCNSSQNPAVESDVINLLDYLEVIVKRRNLICAITLGALLVSIIIALTMTRIYSSTARILPPQQDSGIMGVLAQGGGGAMASMASDLLGKGGAADLYAKILESEAIKDPIIDRFNIITEENTKYRIFAYNKLDKKVQIEVGKKDGIISITVDDKNPKRAADMANAYVEELGKLAVRLNVAGASNNRVYLEERLAQIKVSFDKASDALKAFQLKYKALDVTEQAKGTIKSVAELEGRLAAEEVRLAGMRRIFTDSSQDIKNQQSVVANLRMQIDKFEGNKQGGSMPAIGSVPALGQDYLRLIREFKMQETLFELLTKQYELAKLSESKNTGIVQVIQKARESDKSLKPSRRNFVIMVTAAAFVTSILLSFVLESSQAMDVSQKERFRRLCRQFVAVRRDT